VPYPPAALPTDNTDDTPADGGYHADDLHNATGAAVNDVVDELGNNPSGASADLTARLTALDATVAAKETPAAAQAKVDAHRDVAAPHAGHETPAGAQAKVDVEVAARVAAVIAEATSRANADTALDGRLDTVEATLPVKADLVGGVVPDAQIPAGIARDAEMTAAIQAAVNALLDGAPGALDTLNELAAAIGDDADFAGAVTAALADKADLDAGNVVAATWRGALGLGTSATRDVGTAAGTVAAGDDARLAPTTFAEAVQDAVGAMAIDGATVNFTYDDGGGTITAEVQGLTSASLSDFAEAVRDRVGATLVAGAGISVTVDDPGDTVTVASTITQYTDEAVRDAVGAALVAGNNIDITVNDGADTITIDVEALTSADVGDFAEAVDDRVNALLVAGANVTLTYDDGANTLTVAATGGGGGVSDGDKGDITVSGGGSAWTVDNNAITLAKLADIATARILGRTTAGSGDPEELTAAQVRTLLGISAFIETLLDDANAATALATLGAIPLSVVDAADDLIVGSAADTVTRLAVDASRIVGKKATGGLAALTAAETALLSGGLLAAVSYNPATSVSVATTSTTFADIDATNLVLPFTVPPSGKVLVRMSAAVVTADLVAMNWNLRDAGGDIAGTRAVVIRPAGGQRIRANTAIVVTGLTPGEAKSWKWGQARTTSTGTCETLYGQTDISALGTPGAAVMEVYAIP
jgi:hypothetical protein